MPDLDTLTERDLQAVLSAQSLSRAHGYLDRIDDGVRCGQTLSARVRGTHWYQVEVHVSPDGIHATCTCPYDWGGCCKHVGALLLQWLRAPSAFAVESPPDGSPLAVTPVEPPPTNRPRSLPAWLADTWHGRRQQERQQLTTSLDRMSMQDLRALARQRGWAVRGTRKAEVVEQILAHVDDPADLRRALDGLDREHAQVLRALVLLGAGGTRSQDVARLAATWGELRRHTQVETYSRHLSEQGLALSPSIASGYAHAQVDHVPPALVRHLAPMLEGLVPASHDLPARGTAGGLRLADPYALVDAANQLTLLLDREPVPLRPPMPRPRLERVHQELRGWEYNPFELAQAEREGLLGRRPGLDLALTVPPPAHPLPDPAVARLSPWAGDPDRLEFLYHLLLAAGIVQPGSPVTVWPEVRAEWLRRDKLAQRALLSRLYVGLASWSELWQPLRADAGLRLKRVWSYVYFKPETLLTGLAWSRHLVVRALACLPDGLWVQTADLDPLLRAVWPRFEGAIAESPYLPPWFLTRNGLPLRPDDPGDWSAAQGAFVRQAVAGPLHWLGLADLLLDGVQLLAFRLHGLADLYWDRVEAPAVPPHAAAHAAPAQAVTTGDDTITIAPSRVSAQAHSLLDRIACLEVTAPDRFVYRLNARAACRAFEAGAVLEDLLSDWERLLAVPVPQAIARQLAAWWAAYGRVRLYQNLTVIEFGDDYALAEIKAVTSLSQHLVAEISPQLVIVRPDAVGSLISELEKAGYTPKQTEEV